MNNQIKLLLITITMVLLLSFTNTYTIRNDWRGKDLHPGSNKGWEYFSRGDPTHGKVHYGQHSQLLKEEGSNLKIEVEQNINHGATRKSIRLNTRETYQSGLFVMKAEHMPAGLGTWPSFWLTGKSDGSVNWPCYGEIDIVEGVNSVDSNAHSSINAATLHTTAGCNQHGVKGIHNPNCNAGQAGHCGCDKRSQCAYTGCGVKHGDTHSFGAGFNRHGGGAYAMELTEAGKVTVWFFPKGSIPSDIEANSPNPNNWGRQYVTADFNKCPGHFKNLQIVINTTLCGDWAGNTFDDGRGNKGKSNCEGAVGDPRYKMSEAYWLFNYVKVFTNTRMTSENVVDELFKLASK